MTETLFVVGVWLVLAATVGLVGSGRRGRAAALVLAVGSLLASVFVPKDLVLLRGAAGLGGVLLVFRAIDLARDRRSYSPAFRVWLVLSPFDARRTKRAPPSLALGQVAAGLGYAILAAAGAYVTFIVAPERASEAARLALRWGAGAVFCYAALDAFVALLSAGYRTIGVVLPVVQRAPILSRSVQEFWGERWNLAVHDWLAMHCFLPLARRRKATLGVLAAFGVSTALHMWFVLLALGLVPSLWMGAFFMLQAFVMLLERKVGAARLRPSLGHAWTVFWVLGTSPLFVEPMLRIFEGG